MPTIHDIPASKAASVRPMVGFVTARAGNFQWLGVGLYKSVTGGEGRRRSLGAKSGILWA
jgi:hypothetical protein